MNKLLEELNNLMEDVEELKKIRKVGENETLYTDGTMFIVFNDEDYKKGYLKGQQAEYEDFWAETEREAIEVFKDISDIGHIKHTIYEDVIRTGTSLQGNVWKESLLDKIKIDVLGVEIPYQITKYEIDNEESWLKNEFRLNADGEFYGKLEELQKVIERILITEVEKKGYTIDRFGGWTNIGIPNAATIK